MIPTGDVVIAADFVTVMSSKSPAATVKELLVSAASAEAAVIPQVNVWFVLFFRTV